MQPNIQLACDCPNYVKYKTFYDEALAYESSLYWDFAKCLLTCSAIGIVLFFLFAFVRIRTIEEFTSSSMKMKRQVSTKKVSEPSSPISPQRDLVSSSSSSDYSSSTSDSSLDSRRSFDSSSETPLRRRPTFVPNRHSFAKMMGTIKDIPQKVQDEVQMPSFGRRQSGKKMKRSQSTSQVILPSETLSTPVLSSSVKDDSPVFTSPFAVGDDLNRSTRILEPISPTTPSPASARNLECSSAPAVLEYVQGRPTAPPTARRPSLNFAKSLHDISMSMGPRSPSIRFPLPRRASARSFLGIHVEDQEGETEL